MLTIPSPIIMVIIHGLFAITCLMLFFPAQTKAVRNLASVNEQGKASVSLKEDAVSQTPYIWQSLL